MYSTTYTAHHNNMRRAPARSYAISAPNVNPTIKKIILAILAVNFALVGIIYMTLFMFPQPKYTMAGTTRQIVVGPATQSFIDDLKTNTIKPIPIAVVTRPPLTVEGRTISMNGDNIQVFEYPSAKEASKEADILAKAYEVNSGEEVLPEKNVHIYAKDKLLIFYMGSSESIMKSITGNSYQTMGGISLYSQDEVSAISKNGSYYK